MRRLIKRIFRRGGKEPETVLYLDLSSGTTVEIPKEELSPQSVLAQLEGSDQPVYVDADLLEPGPHQHPSFDGDLRAAIMILVEDLADVLPRSYEQWEDDFRRDSNPEREIGGWVRVAAILETMTRSCSLDAQERKDCFRVLFACLNGSQETVRQRSDTSHLSPDLIGLAISCFYEGQN